jgi:uncharacterized protein YndB with AHSA1/START domain
VTITAHVYQIFIRATPEQVWKAVIDPEWTRRYFHGTAFDSPPVQGRRYRTSLSNGDPGVEGVIEEMDPPHRFVQTWRVLYDAATSQEPPSRVEWTIDSVGDGLTRVRLVHGDLALSPRTWAGVRDGWAWILDSMKSLIETGSPLPAITVDLGAQADSPPDGAGAAGDWHRAQAIEANNAVWGLVGNVHRAADDDEQMLRSAYAAAYHWQRATGAGPVNEARASYMIAKAHLLAGSPELSLGAAQRSMDVVRANGLIDFDLAYAHEARAAPSGSCR